MEEEINLKEIVKGIWRRKSIIIVITITAMIIAIIVGFFYSENKNVISDVEEKDERIMYAKTSFTVVQTESYKINDNTSTTYQHILKSTHNMERVIEKFGLDMEPDELAGSLWIRRVDYSDIIELGVTNENLIDDSIEILNDLVVMLNNELKNTYSINDIYVVQKPIILEIDDEDEKENEGDVANQLQESGFDIKKVIVITLAGGIVGFVIVIGLEIIDGSVKNENQIINTLKINNLANISLKQKENEIEEEFRKIKLNIKDNKSILITSLDSNNRKNEIVNGITDLYAKYGKKVALIDITENHLDVYDINLDKEFHYKKTKLADSSNNLVELLETEKIKEILKKLSDEFDIIVVNANNIFSSINSLAISKFVDAIICIVELRKTKMNLLEKTIQNLENIDSNLLGTIVIED